MLGENLLNLRKVHGFSQEYVAERIGVSRQAVAKWENGTSTPDIANCAALAELYNVTLDELVHFESHGLEGITVPPKGKYVFGTVKVGEKGQIVIPVKARRIFHIEPGTELLMLGDIDEGLALIRADHFVGIFDELRKGARK